MNIANKRIGIWGFGLTGSSVLQYLDTIPCTVTVFEQGTITPERQHFLKTRNIPLITSTDPHFFLENQDLIIPSPGIDLSPYAHYQHKMISELDVYSMACTTPTVAITGSIGKTSITHLLGQLCVHAGIKTQVGGNIGTPMLDLLGHPAELNILELSSFQLEQNRAFAPDLGIWTTFLPNHLDRHVTMENYFAAKYQQFAHQNADQNALVPLELIEKFNTTHPLNARRHFFSWDEPDEKLVSHLRPDDCLYWVRNTTIVAHKPNNLFSLTPLIALDELPALSMPFNWLVIVSALDILRIPLSVIPQAAASLTLPEHRLEKVATINEIDFYNDSKSTTSQATLAAVTTLKNKPIHLLLGGMGKGIDRAPLIKQIKSSVAHIYCFGKEAAILYSHCQQAEIASSTHETLEQAFDACTKKVRPQEIVLLSPAGTSYDLFKNFEERGKRFKELVLSCKKS